MRRGSAGLVVAAARPRSADSAKPMVRPAPAAAAPIRNWRRLDVGRAGSTQRHRIALSRMVGLQAAGRFVHGGADAVIGGAAADVAGHARRRCRRRWASAFSLEQRHRGHDLAGLAIAALRHVESLPGGLHGVRDLAGDALDGGDLAAVPRADRRRRRSARPGRRYARCRRRTAPARSRTWCRSDRVVAQDPEQRHIRGRHRRRGSFR